MPGGPAGDAYVSIRTRADLRFTRAGADLRSDLHIGAPDTALGITTAVPTLQGQARVRVPPGTRPGSVLRVAGKGLPRYGGHGRGNLNLTVILDIPRQPVPEHARPEETPRPRQGPGHQRGSPFGPAGRCRGYAISATYSGISWHVSGVLQMRRNCRFSSTTSCTVSARATS